MSTDPSSTRTAPQPHAQKDASHAAFYAGFAKGMASALQGILLFASSKPLQSQFYTILRPLFRAQIAYAACAILIFLLLRDPADDLSELFWTMSRWGRLVTVITTFILDKHLNINAAIFHTALQQLNPQFGAAVQQRSKTKTTLGEKWRKFKRVAKLALFKVAGTLINKLVPGGKYIAIPAVKFVSMRPVLGAPVAAAFAAVHALPVGLLESSRVDDMLIAFGEAVIDANDLGSDGAKPFVTRLENEEMREYFAERYKGYLTGCGFVYSLLESVPFLGIPATLVSECGAACLVVDIVKRNLDKENRKPLICEDMVARPKVS